MVVVTGPTGSGKTTTLYAALSEIATPEDKIITIEDPVEYQISLITQVPVNEKKGLTFARGLRSILRHDPDKIMVGEVRDPETAQIAVQSALTGTWCSRPCTRTTCSTSSAASCTWASSRTTSSPPSTASSPSGWCACCAAPASTARRSRSSCCRSPGSIPTSTRSRSSTTRRAATSGGSGFVGRTAVGELLDMSDRIRQDGARAAPQRRDQAGRARGGHDLAARLALEKVFAGVTTLREINKVTFVAWRGRAPSSCANLSSLVSSQGGAKAEQPERRTSDKSPLP